MALVSAVSPEKLSFDRHLRHAFAPLSARLAAGIGSLDGIIEMLRLRIEAESVFAESLHRILSNEALMSSLSPLESLRRDGMVSIHSDMKNEHTQRLEFINSLSEDVYRPVVAMRDLYAQKNRSFANDTKLHIKALRRHRAEFFKAQAKYEKVCSEAATAREALLDAKLESKASSSSLQKLGQKLKGALHSQQQWKAKFDGAQLLWTRRQTKFDDEMSSILQGMQCNEFNRMRTAKDSMNKWTVFVTNFCANRNYDVKNLAHSMSLIDIDRDLQCFLQRTLRQHPPENLAAPIPPHHALHFGRQQIDALNALNKTSSERAKAAKTAKIAKHGKQRRPSRTKMTKTTKNGKNGKRAKSAKNVKPPRTPSLGHQPYSSSIHLRGQSDSFSSFSSFGGSTVGGGHQRGESGSAQSLSGQMDPERTTRRVGAAPPSPNSLGGFFQNKFQKQRAYNSQRNGGGFGHETGVYPPAAPEDEEVNSPPTPRLMGSASEQFLAVASNHGNNGNNGNHGGHSNHGSRDKARDMLSGASALDELGIMPPPILSNELRGGRNVEMISHPIQPRLVSSVSLSSASAQQIRLRNSKRLKKPSKKIRVKRPAATTQTPPTNSRCAKTPPLAPQRPANAEEAPPVPLTTMMSTRILDSFDEHSLPPTQHTLSDSNLHRQSTRHQYHSHRSRARSRSTSPSYSSKAARANRSSSPAPMASSSAQRGPSPSAARKTSNFVAVENIESNCQAALSGVSL